MAARAKSRDSYGGAKLVDPVLQQLVTMREKGAEDVRNRHTESKQSHERERERETESKAGGTEGSKAKE